MFEAFALVNAFGVPLNTAQTETYLILFQVLLVIVLISILSSEYGACDVHIAQRPWFQDSSCTAMVCTYFYLFS